jgi:hypothetical protein
MVSARVIPMLLLVAACSDGNFRPESLVDQLRVLAVQSTPADLHPGETAQLHALAPNPAGGGAVTLVWLACEPDPLNRGLSACADLSVLQDPAAFFGPAGQLPPGVSVIGFNDTASWSAPARLFDALDAGDPRRTTGTVEAMVLFAVAEAVPLPPSPSQLQSLLGRVQDGGVRSELGLYRVRVSEDPQRNRNPQLAALLVGPDGGQPWPRGATLALLPDQALPLELSVPGDTFETYTAITPDGPQARTEQLLVAWYATAGRFSWTRTVVGGTHHTALTGPGGGNRDDPLPAGRQGTVWAVVRDTRGGQVWASWPFFVCDPALPEPVVSAVAWTAGSLVLRGRDLGSVLDVVVQGQALPGTPGEDGGTWESPLPQGLDGGSPPGPVTVTARTCTAPRLVP